MTVSVPEITNLLTSALQAASNPIDADKMEAYMKNRFPFYGVKAPARTALLRPILKTYKANITEQIQPLVHNLWQQPAREYQMLAMELLGKCQKNFTPTDLPFVEELITTKSWWDTVDYLASNTIGHILALDAGLARNTAHKYIESENLWLRRTALLFQLKYKDQVDEQLLYALIDKSLGEQEFFIRKACGWALRQYSKYNHKSVKAYMEANKEKMSTLTWREGSKYL